MSSATQFATDLTAIAERWLQCARRWLRVFWVCRVSTCSVAAGMLLFLLPQVQDLFLDVTGVGGFALDTGNAPYILYGILERFLFALWVFAFWALPTHAIARLAVTDPAWLHSPYGLNTREVDEAKLKLLFAPAVAWVPRLLGALCFVAAIAGALVASAPLRTWDTVLRIRVLIELFWTVLFLAGFGYFFWRYALDRRGWFNNRADNLIGRLTGDARSGASRRKVPDRPGVAGQNAETMLAVRIDWIISAFIALVLLLILVLAGFIDVFFARLWLIPLLLGAWTPLFGWLGRLSHRTGAPAILGFAILLAALDHVGGDDHVIDLVAANGKRQLTFDLAVRRWAHENACDVGAGPDPYQSCPSPIIVAAEGGASRSAFFTATVLGLLTDATCEGDWREGHAIKIADRPDGPKTCGGAPIFTKQLFAISGVSGGAVAAGIYVRALDDSRPSGGEVMAVPCRTDIPTDDYFAGTTIWTWRACLQAIAARDFLSPVMAGLGFRDVFAFIGGWAPKLWPDRGHRLEDSLADAYDRFIPPKSKERNGLRGNFLDLAPAEGEPWRPIVLLNATSVDGGERYVFSTIQSLPPVEDPASPTKDEREAAIATNAFDFYRVIAARKAGGDAAGGCDLSLVQAMHNSARFPIISPAGRVREPEHGCAPGVDLDQVVDGGYFDNYGALAVHDLVRALQNKKLHPFLLLITNDPDEAPAVDANGEPPVPPADWSLEPPREPSSESTLPFSLRPLTLIPVVIPPLDAVIEARSAHGEYGVRLTRRLLDPAIDDGGDRGDHGSANGNGAANCFVEGREIAEPCYAHVAVFPQSAGGTMGDAVKSVSMSWWISKTVQEYLDEQVQAPPGDAAGARAATAGQRANRAALHKVCAALRSKGQTADWCDLSLDSVIGFAKAGG